MIRNIISITGVFLWIFPAKFTPAIMTPYPTSYKDSPALRIEVTDTKCTGQYLEIEYRIINGSEHDAWIITDFGHASVTGPEYPRTMRAKMLIDDKTVVIRRLLELAEYRAHGINDGTYVRLRPGHSQTEWIFLKLPIDYQPQGWNAKRKDQIPDQDMQLAIELGYYLGDPPRSCVPETLFRAFQNQYGTPVKDSDKNRKGPPRFEGLSEVWSLIDWSDCLTSMEEECVVKQYWVPGEQVLKKVVDGLGFQQLDEPSQSKEISPANLSSYDRVEIRFQPSALEFFFPYVYQQSLLTPDELKQFKSQKIFVEKEALKAHDIEDGISQVVAAVTSWPRGWDGGTAIRLRSKINVVCFSDDKPERSFSVYWQRDRLMSSEDFSNLLPMPTSRIRAIDSRIQCGENLANQWHRIRIYGQAVHLENPSVVESFKVYPPSSEWCDAMLRPFVLSVFRHRSPKKMTLLGYGDVYICPGATGGKCHYAMNPSCKPDSPADMVLLFETTAGWNQHGGPELFTFDNHNPKGGCVLLNDGTVKFIRTKEELQQLRWK